MGWITKEIERARKTIAEGPKWMRQACESDYSARRQIVKSNDQK